MPRAKKLAGWKDLAAVIVDEVRQYIDERVAAVEQRRGVNLADVYAGTFSDGTQYTRGQVVTHGGSLWLCMVDTQTRPGDSGDWRLVVRKGKDGK